ncbi:MAG: hypothetical protein Q7T53_01855 [Deltaproteobacteria bacterium]|nr:hypothetical protein [Deltaproteobacteria bacterium]
MEMTPNAYNAWSIVLQVMIWTAMIATFIVYYLQLKAMQKGAIGQNILSLINFLQATNVRDARTSVLKSLKLKKYADWNEDEKREASLVCSNYDVASILILQQKLVPLEPFVSNWGPSIKGCFEICREHIAEMQKPENSGPHYWNDFNILYDEVIKHTAQPGSQEGLRE